VADARRVERKSEVTSGTVSVLVEGIGSKTAGFGVAVPDGAAEREAGVGCLGGGRRMSTVYEGVLDEARSGAVRMAVWSTSSYLSCEDEGKARQFFIDHAVSRNPRMTEEISETHNCVLPILHKMRLRSVTNELQKKVSSGSTDNTKRKKSMSSERAILTTCSPS
jgi:hypothetical protein